MNTKEQYIQWIEQQLNSPTWNSLKTSFIGRELIEYAATILYLSDQQKLSIQDNQYPDTADLKSMLLMAFNRDIAVDLNKPAYVKISNVGVNLTSPYQASLKSGNILFTNYDYIVPNQVATLHQGLVKTMYTEELTTIQEAERVPMTVYYDVEEESYFVKLGRNAIAESVRVIKEDGSLFVLSEYDSLREDPDADLMKIKRNTDLSLNVYFGNGTWGKKYDSALNYQIVWLEGTQEDFDITSLSMTINNQAITFDVESYDSGKTDDISYTRKMLKAAIDKLSVAATESQIKAFVNSYPSIIDSEIALDIDQPNKVTIYVKPTVIEDTIFDQIQDALNLYGEIVTQYFIQRGEPLYYYVVLEKIGTITQQKTIEIEELIRQELAYENQPYISKVSSIRLNELISPVSLGTVIVSILFRLYLEEASQVINLPTRPYRGTIQLYQNGTLIGWDSEGILYGALTPLEVSLSNFIKLGDFFISGGQDKVLSYNATFTVAANNTGALPLNGLIDYRIDSERALIKFADRFIELDINEAFTEGDFSIQKNPSVGIQPFSTISSTLNLDYSVYRKGVGVFKVMEVTEDGKQYYLWKFDINNNLNNTLNFSILVSGDKDWSMKAVADSENDLFVFFKEGIRYVQNFVLPSMSESLRVDNIAELNDLSTIKQVIMKNSFTILKEIKSTKTVVNPDTQEEEEKETYAYQLYRSSGFDIETTTIKRLVLKSAFVLMYEESFEVQQDIKIIQSDMSNILFLNSTAGILYNINLGNVQQLAKQGNTINSVDKVGIVFYVNNQIQLQGKIIQNVTVEYQTSDAMELLPKNMFAVMKDVEWK